MKLAYNGKIEHHWAKHRAQAIALLGSKKDRFNAQQKMHTNNAPYSA
jgi:hypothetical protein